MDEASKVRAALAATQELVLRLERHLSAARQQNAAYEGRCVGGILLSSIDNKLYIYIRYKLQLFVSLNRVVELAGDIWSVRNTQMA